MSGFIASSPVPENEPDLTINDFYLPLSASEFRLAYRIDSSYTAAAVKRAMIEAAVNVTDDLARWQFDQKTAGYTALVDVPSPSIDGKSRLTILFEQAVFCFAKANLIDTYRDVDTTRELGNDRASDHELSSDFWRREGREAIHKLLNRPAVESVLI